MKQLRLAETDFLPKAGKQTRKAVFLAEMETVVPCSRLESLIEPFYPKKESNRGLTVIVVDLDDGRAVVAVEIDQSESR